MLSSEQARDPVEIETPYFGKHLAVTIKTANGFLVECIECQDGSLTSTKTEKLILYPTVAALTDTLEEYSHAA